MHSLTAQTAKEHPRIPELDGVRGLAVALVLVWHYIPCLVQASPGTPLARLMVAMGLTWAGVDVFFVLSGFLIGGILLAKRGSPNFFRTFYIRRACRILPPYVILLIASMALWWFTGKTHSSPLAWMFDRSLPWFTFPLFIQNFVMAVEGHFGPQPLGVTWTLAIEEQFYLLTPFLAWRCKTYIPHCLFGAVVGGMLFRMLVYENWPYGGHAAYVLLPCRWDALCIGFLLAWAFRRPGWKEALSTSVGRKWLWAVTLTCLAIAGTLAAMMQSIASPGMSYGGYTVIALGTASVLSLALTVDEHSVLRRTLRSRVLMWLGGISYMVYLMHELLLGLIHSIVRGQKPQIVDAEDVLLTLLSLVVTLGLSTASWHWFERPIVRFGQRFSY